MLDPSFADVDGQYNKLLNEIRQHHKESKNKKSIILITKNDIINDIDLSKLPNNIRKISISSVSGFNIKKAIQEISKLFD